MSGGRAWLFVLGERTWAERVVGSREMGFRDDVHAERIKSGDGVALYVTRGAFHNPTRDRASIVGVGHATGSPSRAPMTIEGHTFPWTCPFDLDVEFPLRSGAPFAPLVPELSFIRKKEAWFNYVRRALVPIPDGDYQILAGACRNYQAESA